MIVNDKFKKLDPHRTELSGKKAFAEILIEITTNVIIKYLFNIFIE